MYTGVSPPEPTTPEATAIDVRTMRKKKLSTWKWSFTLTEGATGQGMTMIGTMTTFQGTTTETGTGNTTLIILAGIGNIHIMRLIKISWKIAELLLLRPQKMKL